LLIILTVVVAVGITALTADTRKQYVAHSTLYIGANSFSAGPGGNLSGDQANAITQLIRTFSVMIDSDAIAQDAITRTGLPRSANGVVNQTVVQPVKDTNLLVIAVGDPDPVVAQSLATGIAEAFVSKIGELEPGRDTEGAIPNAPVRIFERAKLPTFPTTSSTTGDLIFAGLLGLLASVALVLLVEYLDITVKSSDDAEARLDLPVLGVIPRLSLDPKRTVHGLQGPRRDDLGLVRDA
jgi:capsular polysaccharide biosynthesis protein